MAKKSFVVSERVNPNMLVGDKVKFIDGSGFSFDEKYYWGKDIIGPYIVYSYPDVFESDAPVEYIPFIVIETGVKNRVLEGVVNTGYVQDIVLKAPNGAIVYSASAFVEKIN